MLVQRRSLLGAAAGGLLLLPVATPALASSPHEISPDEALRRLKEGNHRWVHNELLARDSTRRRRARVAQAQHPLGVVFSCIDSRVPPEYVFDQDLGEIFVVRTAGHAVSPVVTGSVEYGPDHGTPLVVVLGHQRCGAVTAAVDAFESGNLPTGNIGKIVEAIGPAYDCAKPHFKPAWGIADRVRATTVAHTRMTVSQLERDPLLRKLLDQHAVKIVGGYYSLDSGKVHWL